uniref:Uncharacterized protein n=1 Tax=Rangifer tarandus platyrhynchus TaxID=3082113 RepID=A0ACB0DRC6_RANTA|nr:unnamed protein product [Rangifer tarandus platyrhynchus]
MRGKRDATKVSARGRETQPHRGVRSQSAPVPCSGSPGRRPYLPHLRLPLGHPMPNPAKKEVSGPKRAADTRSGRDRDTCEARHLRAKRGPPGLPRAHPLGRRVLCRGRNLRTCEARELQARAAPPHLSGSRSPSASRCRRHRRRRWRPGHDELRAPPPCPPRRELHWESGGRTPYLPAEAGVAGTAALRSGSWVVDFPAEAPKREEGPKANPQGSETPALDVHLRPVY